MPKTAYIVLSEMGVDQICETADDARAEVQWLRAHGFKSRYIECPWEEQDAKVDELEGRK